MEKSEHSYWCWNYKSGSPFWKESSSTPTNSRQRPTVSSNPPFLGKCPGELKTKSTQNLCMEVHSSVFTTVKTWRQPKCSSTDQWINYTYIYVHYNEIFFGNKRNEALRDTGAWITLGNIMLSQRSRQQGLHTIGFHLQEITRTDKSTGAENTLVATKG